MEDKSEQLLSPLEFTSTINFSRKSNKSEYRAEPWPTARSRSTPFQYRYACEILSDATPVYKQSRHISLNRDAISG